jgi:hypothetical protein
MKNIQSVVLLVPQKISSIFAAVTAAAKNYAEFVNIVHDFDHF